MLIRKRKRHRFDQVYLMSAPTGLFPTERTVVSPLSPVHAPRAHSSRSVDHEAPRTGITDRKLSLPSEFSEHRFYYPDDFHNRVFNAEDERDEGDKQTSFIEKHLLMYKGFYFLFFGAVGSLFPYLAVFYKQLFLSAQQVGFLIGVRPFIQMIAGPLWGALADTYNVRKVILLMSIMAWLGTNYSISLVRQDPNSPSCQANFSYLRLPEYGRVSSDTPVTKTIAQTTFLSGRQRNYTSKFNSSKNKIENSLHIPLATSSRTSQNVTFELRGMSKIDALRRRRATHYVERFRRGVDYTTTTKNDDFWEQYQAYNVTHGEGLLGIQRLLAADELEEEFDSLNMDDAYPWPLDTIEGTHSKEVNRDTKISKQASKIFLVLIILTVFGTIIASPAATLADTATLQNLGDKPYHYGRQRLWGAFGWGLCALIVGITVSSIQDSSLCLNPRHVDYILSFYVYAGMMGLALLLAIFFKFDPVEDSTPYSESLWEAVRMFSDCQHGCFVLTLLCSGAAMGFIHTFLFWHLHDIGGTQFLFSVVAGVQCVSEVFMYFLSGYLILNIGWDSVFYIGLLANVLRLFAYAVIQQPMYSVPIEILQGVSSASIWTAAICYIGLIPGAQVTLQALLHGIYWGLGHGGGGILGGVMVTYIGSNATFIVYGIICLANLAILVTIKYWSKIMELMGNYTYVENIPAGTYILRNTHPPNSTYQESR